MPDFQQVQVISTTPRQVVFAGGGPVLIENRDLANNVYLGTDEGFDSDDANAGILDPLGNKAFDGSVDVWAVTASGTSLVIANPGGLGSQVSPTLIAAQLATSGLATSANQTNNSQVAQPHVPGINSRLLQGPGTFTIGQAHRLWAYVFTFSYASNGSYSGSNDVTAQFADPFSTFALCTLEFTILSPSTHETQVCALSLPGINETTGPYGVTMTTPPTNVSMRTNLTILYSIP